jgi:hypothetical protein
VGGFDYWRDQGLIKLLIMSDGLKQVQLCFVGEVGEVEMREGDVRLRLFESGGGMKTRTCTLVDL